MKNYVIFVDLGEVFFTFDNALVARTGKKLGRKPKEVTRGLMINWHEHAEGKISEAGYWKKTAKSMKLTKSQTTMLRKMLYASLVPQEGMLETVRKLKQNYKVVVLSSQITGWVRFLEKKYKFSREFHDHHYSYNHGVDKPDVRLFLSAARRMKVKPEDCIVIDDLKEFVAAVKKTGAKTILFKNVKQMTRELRKMGVKL